MRMTQLWTVTWSKTYEVHVVIEADDPTYARRRATYVVCKQCGIT